MAGVRVNAAGDLFGSTEFGGAKRVRLDLYVATTAPGKTNWREKVIFSFADGNDGGFPGSAFFSLHRASPGTTMKIIEFFRGSIALRTFLLGDPGDGNYFQWRCGSGLLLARRPSDFRVARAVDSAFRSAGAITAPSAPPRSVPTTKPDNARYVADPNLLAACQADLDAFKDKPCNVIFIGGTATSGWRDAGHAIWQKYYEPRQALNFSVAGDTTQNVLWRLNNMELQGLHPRSPSS